MKKIWKLQDAKAKFSQLVEEAIKEGPQVVTRHGTKAVVVISAEDFEELTSTKPSFKDFLLDCPKGSEGLNLERVKDKPRSINL